MAWPDLLIGAILLIAAVKGWRRGFVAELGGAVAFFAALATPWWYNGSADGWIAEFVHLGPGSAHVIGMFLTGLLTYAVIIAIAWLLGGIAKLPVISIGNGIGGALIGFLKGALLCWLVLYLALFFPLSLDLRSDLHRSQLVHALVQPDDQIDRAILATVPWFARPFLRPYFRRHDV